jgi:hypothetical protein
MVTGKSSDVVGSWWVVVGMEIVRRTGMSPYSLRGKTISGVCCKLIESTLTMTDFKDLEFDLEVQSSHYGHLMLN